MFTKKKTQDDMKHTLSNAIKNLFEQHEATIKSQLPFYNSKIDKHEEQSIEGKMNLDFLTFGTKSEQTNKQAQINSMFNQSEISGIEKLKQLQQTKKSNVFVPRDSEQDLKFMKQLYFDGHVIHLTKQ